MGEYPHRGRVRRVGKEERGEMLEYCGSPEENIFFLSNCNYVKTMSTWLNPLPSFSSLHFQGHGQETQGLSHLSLPPTSHQVTFGTGLGFWSSFLLCLWSGTPACLFSSESYIDKEIRKPKGELLTKLQTTLVYELHDSTS